jgi:pyrroloquinoline quinone biosynthesis protein D
MRRALVRARCDAARMRDLRRVTAGGDGANAPRFARGVRFRRLADGSGVLLIPEGVVTLSETAAAVAELLDGARTSAEIARALAAAFDAPPEHIAADVDELIAGFADKTWLELPESRAR